MQWKKWLTVSAIILVVTTVVAVTVPSEEIIGVNVAALAGIFSGVGYLAWWENRNEQHSDEMT